MMAYRQEILDCVDSEPTEQSPQHTAILVLLD